MPRILTGPGDDPAYTDVAGEDTEKREILEPDEGRHHPATHCLVCGRPLEAQLTCVACGDEERAA
jgi:hypothetical protein